MNQFFRRLPLSVKLILIGLVPVVFLLFLTIQINKEKGEKLAILDNYAQRVNQSVMLANTIDELQTERRFSFGYVLKHDWRTELVLQRPKTDSAIKKLERVQGERLAGVVTYTFLDSLQDVRLQVDQG